LTNLSKEPRRIFVQYVNNDGDVIPAGTEFTVESGHSFTARAAATTDLTLLCVFRVLNGSKRDILAQGTLANIDRSTSPGKISISVVQSAQ